ncbi:MAG TPA: ATP-binding protein [Roseiarcus sp.]|nr:ATP-binding protein [Roseiarcus sp.]
MTASLRRTALLWMTGLLTVVGLVTILIAYGYVRGEADEFLDGQLRQIALNAGTGVSVANAPEAVDHDPEDQFAITIWDERGRVVHQSLAGVAIARQARSGFADVNADGERWRVYATHGGGRTVQVAQRETVRAEIIGSAAIAAAAPILIVIPLSWLVVGWAMNRMLRRLDVLESEIAKRTATATEPLPLEGVPAEIRPLVASMNGLIERLRAAVDAQKLFLADAAHELRTPLAAMQIQVDNLAAGPAAPIERVAALAAGVKRASALVNQLLRLARLEGPGATERQPVNVGAILLDGVADAAPVAEAKKVDIGAHIRGPAWVAATEADMRTLFGALIDNAVRYTPAGGSIDVNLLGGSSGAVVEILDTGPGLPKGCEDRIFDRFFRGAPHDTEGAGLGLAIARRIAERHALALTVENRTDGHNGARARVELGSATKAPG